MKKKSIALLISSAFAMALASCGTVSSSSAPTSSDLASSVQSVEDVSSNSSAEEEISSAEEVSEASSEDALSWSEEIEAAMKENLYGEVLPFVDVEFDLTVEAGTVLLTSVDESFDFQDVLATADLFGSDYVRNDTNYYSMLVKPVSTDEGTRYVGVQIAALDSEGYAIYEDEDNFGKLIIQAGDPFLYEFPEEIVAEFTEYYDTSSTVPSFEAEYYQVGYEYGTLFVYGYGAEEDAEDAYATALSENGWTLTEGRSEYGYRLAISSDEKIQVEFAYDSDYGSFDIMLSEYEKIYDAWPEEEVASYVSSIAPGSESVVPAFEGDGYTYNIWDLSDDGGQYYIYINNSSEEAIEPYIAALEEAGWAITLDEESYPATYICVSPNADIAINVYYYIDAVVVVVGKYEGPVKEWPTEAIAAALANRGVTDVLPAYEGADCYMFLNDESFTQIYAYVEEGTEQNAVDSYIATLIENGFTLGPSYLSDQDTYVSANKELAVEVWWNEDAPGAITIYFEPYAFTTSEELPNDFWTAFFTNKGFADAANAIPSIEGTSFTYFTEYGESPWALIYVEGGDMQTILSSLTEKGFAVPTEPSEYCGYECKITIEGYEVEIDVMEVEGAISISGYIWAAEE
ncbi:MAG: hypothetical protein K6F32_02280 [Bacilli bacterium]|nr:hypothetical protein [Bacilli bacterium]